MKKILKKLVYELDDSGISNSRYNDVDCVCAFIYFLISVFNAFHCGYNIQIFNENGEMEIEIESVATMLVIIINFVILIRMYIRLHLQYIAEEKIAKGNLDKNERYDKITIESLEIRLSRIRDVWLISMVVMVFICYFGNVVVNAVCAMAVVCATLTLFNDLIDIAINKYSAKSKPAIIRYIK